MPYIYADAESLIKTPPAPNVGSGHCVPLVQQYAGCPQTSEWSEGDPVRDNKKIAKGTAIATFVGGKYPNAQSGNHAALFISQDKHGIWVVDQYKNSGGIKKRYLQFKGKKDNVYVDPSNNGDAFSVIEP